MEVYLIRHTTPDVAHGVCYGQSDLQLVPSFQEEFDEIKQKIPPVLDAFYSSPLVRCRQLAHYLSDEVVIDPRLKEYDFGEWELKRWDDIPKAVLDPWMKDFVNHPAPAGESMVTMQRRVLAFFADLSLKEYTRVAVITHSVVIRIIRCHLEKKPLQQAFDIKLNYGEVMKVDLYHSIFK